MTLAWYRLRKYALPAESMAHLTNGNPDVTLCGFQVPEGVHVLRGDEAAEGRRECATCRALEDG